MNASDVVTAAIVLAGAAYLVLELVQPQWLRRCHWRSYYRARQREQRNGPTP